MIGRNLIKQGDLQEAELSSSIVLLVHIPLPRGLLPVFPVLPFM